MTEERDYSKRDSFEPYSYTDEDGITYVSPFIVAVFGIHSELLGTGNMIGRTRDVLGGNPVIELDDPTSPMGSVEILGAECWWSPISPDTNEIPEMLASVPEAIIPASVYLKTLVAENN